MLQNRLSMLEFAVRETKVQSLYDQHQHEEALDYLTELGLVQDMINGQFGMLSITLFLFVSYTKIFTSTFQINTRIQHPFWICFLGA
jgi:hypothetical protein